MLVQLELTNFRKHRNVLVDFTGGFNLLRGGNEAGKSTMIEALLYALYGARALRTPLEGAVTRGEPLASLKVCLVFVVDGVTYQIRRGKSGAEIRYGDSSVVGQTETSVFIERLLGMPLKIAQQLVFAGQTSIRGVLEQGGAAAAALIEDLAGLSTLETILAKVQEKLPCGATAHLEGLIHAAKEDAAAEAPQVPDRSLVGSVEVRLQQAQVQVIQARTARDSVEPAAAKARADLAEHQRSTETNARVNAQRQVALGVKKPEAPAFTVADVDLLASQLGEVDRLEKLLQASHMQFPEVLTRVPLQDFEQDYAAKSARRSDILAEVQAIDTDNRVDTVKIIKDKSCPLCQKDLSEVPEVLSINAGLNDAITARTARRVTLWAEKEQLDAYFEEAAAKRKLDSRIRELGGTFWEYSAEMPTTPTWPHGVIEVPTVDRAQLATMRAELAEYATKLSRWENAQNTLANLAYAPEPDISGASEKIETLARAEQALADASGVAQDLVRLHAETKTAYECACRAYELALAQREKDKQRLAELEAQLAEMCENNVLVKALRQARPVIADKLWSVVLGTVSHYLGQVRGERSVVTRTDAGFFVGGLPAASLSGSALDAFGLALRIALVRTFAPNAALLVLDEPAAACDDTRELALLGAVAGAGFPQVLLVTHSNLADSFASKVIQL